MQNYNSKVKKFNAFTLIELLVAIAIIAVISTVGLTSYTAAQKRSRDVRRQSDLHQYQVALENYASVTGGTYPKIAANGNAAAGSGLFAPAGPLVGYVTGFPTDPRPAAGAGYDYYYRADATGIMWLLQACMEGGTDKIYQVCSTGKTGVTLGSPNCVAPGNEVCGL